ncbi:MAG: dihydrofolate reductase [Bacilli bacterium]|nr:dihydrofolate reductase [Bacilli bacterium]MDD4734415.1 dihydrofolate reductase [Bacilli bacterium]
MNLTMIASNDDSKSKYLWKILEECDLFNSKLNNKPIIVREHFFKTIPVKNPKRRLIVISENFKNNDSNILVFENKSKLLKRLDLLTEEVYMVCDIDMYNYFLPYINNLYFIEFKNSTNKLTINNKNFVSNNIIENNDFKMIEYRKEKENVR